MEQTTEVHIAYADDHKAVRKGIISFLNGLGGIIVDIEANNGKELIRQMEKANQLPDVCIIDINMPQMDGFETLVEIKKRWRSMKVLILTVHDTELYIIIRMIRSGANGYLLKSCDPEEIKKALFTIHTKGVYFSDVISSQFFHAVQNREIKLPNFTAKEIEVLKYCCTDLSYVKIAEKMRTTSRSVEGYRDSLFKKLKVNSRVSLALYAVQFGYVPLEIKNHLLVGYSTHRQVHH